LRKKVLEIVFAADEQVSLLDLPIAKSAMTSITDTLDIQDGILKFLENNTDFTTAQAQQKISDFASNIEGLMRSEGLLVDPTLFGAFVTMRQRMKDLKSKMAEKDFLALKGRIVID